MKNKHYSFALFLVGILFIGITVSHSKSTPDHPAPDVDGKVWMSSTEQEKRAFLFGAGSAVVLEYHLRDKHSEEPSRFVKGWVDGLKDMSWSELANRLDSYYRNNPDKMDRHVFAVIWQEIIKPTLKS